METAKKERSTLREEIMEMVISQIRNPDLWKESQEFWDYASGTLVSFPLSDREALLQLELKRLHEVVLTYLQHERGARWK